LMAFKGVLGKALPPDIEAGRTAGFLARRHKKPR